MKAINQDHHAETGPQKPHMTQRIQNHLLRPHHYPTRVVCLFYELYHSCNGLNTRRKRGVRGVFCFLLTFNILPFSNKVTWHPMSMLGCELFTEEECIQAQCQNIAAQWVACSEMLSTMSVKVQPRMGSAEWQSGPAGTGHKSSSY